jgi:hypothetical protein
MPQPTFISFDMCTLHTQATTTILKIQNFFFFFFVVLGFELRVLHLPWRCSVTWAMPQSFFLLLLFFKCDLTFAPGPAWIAVFLFMIWHSWDDRCVAQHPAFLLIEMEVLPTFCPGWPWAVILLSS